ncbi:helix-turn-helix domain-containing protein [Arthrobacter sp. Sr24]
MDRKYLDALFGAYPERMTVTQLSEALNQSKQTTYKWLQTGVIPAYQIEKTWLISRDEVRDWVWDNRNSLRLGKVPHPNAD